MPDGTLELDRKLPLPPGRVEITVAPITVEIEKTSARQALDAILDARKSQTVAGGRSQEEIDTDLQAMRDEWDQRDADSSQDRRGKI
ncbi:MAG: hypothetical protein IT426_04575 [Pirellulales bacterium]|nr:hypothetical protein [Pirellulales bacterium]